MHEFSSDETFNAATRLQRACNAPATHRCSSPFPLLFFPPLFFLVMPSPFFHLFFLFFLFLLFSLFSLLGLPWLLVLLFPVLPLCSCFCLEHLFLLFLLLPRFGFLALCSSAVSDWPRCCACVCVCVVCVRETETCRERVEDRHTREREGEREAEGKRDREMCARLQGTHTRTQDSARGGGQNERARKEQQAHVCSLPGLDASFRGRPRGRLTLNCVSAPVAGSRSLSRSFSRSLFPKLLGSASISRPPISRPPPSRTPPVTLAPETPTPVPERPGPLVSRSRFRSLSPSLPSSSATAAKMDDTASLTITSVCFSVSLSLSLPPRPPAAATFTCTLPLPLTPTFTRSALLLPPPLT